ncbi:hypothetical protein BH09SUM1_BH09SUM1_20520 [soil metagenome]
MFSSKFPKALLENAGRRQIVEQAVAEAKSRYRKQPAEQAREPILELQDQFDQAGLDRLELLYAAESSLPGDNFWLSAIVEILLRKPQLTARELPYLLRQAFITPYRLEIWNRLFKERKALGDELQYFQDRERCALALLPFFPVDEDSTFPDPLMEADAFSMLTKCLSDGVVNVTDLKRTDHSARELLKAAKDFFPDRQEILIHLARIIVKENQRDPASVGAVMQAMLLSPDETELKIWVAGALLEIPRQYENGLAMLRQLHQAHPNEKLIDDHFLAAIKAGDKVSEEDESFVTARLAQDSEDLRALELLADHYAQRKLLTDEALRVYRLAAAQSPKRRNYLRLIGKFYAERGDWSEVIAIFDEIRASGQESDDIILPLAMAYSEFKKSDGDAFAVYKRAIELGTMAPEVHNNYCRLIYERAPADAESVAQFSQTLALFPDSPAAAVGMLMHHLRMGDAGRALDGAITLLQKNPANGEALKAGAEALAKDFTRRQLAKLAALPADILGELFEAAFQLAPDAGPIAMGVVRRRLANNVRNAETARILGEVCRRNPDAMDLRIARADLLWDLGQEENAAGLYRELLERWRGAAPARGVAPELRRRILERYASFLMRPPGPGGADVDLLLDAAQDKNAPAEAVIGAARAVVDLRIDRPDKLDLISRALMLAPGDVKLERAMAEAHAAKGNPVPAIELAMRLAAAKDADEETANLLRSLLAVTEPEQLPLPLLESLQETLTTYGPPPVVLMAGMELILYGREVRPEDQLLLEALTEIFPRNVKMKRLFAKALALDDQEPRAAAVLEELMQASPENDDVVVELALTQARLGQHEKANLKVAEAALRADPANTELLLHLAAIELRMGMFQAAGKRMREVLALDPSLHARLFSILDQNRAVMEQKDLTLLLARLHTRAGRVEQALFLLGRLQGEYQKYYTELLSAYDELIAAAPENPRPRIERGILYRLSHHLDEAVADLSAAHAIAPDNLDILSEYADVLTQMVQAQDVPDPDLCVRVGEIYLELNDNESSFEMTNIALTAHPEHQPSLRLLARLQLNAGALKRCRSTLRKIEERGDMLNFMQQLASAFADEGDHPGAAEVLTMAIEVGGPQKSLLEQLRKMHQDQARGKEDATARQKIMHSLSDRAQGRYELKDEIGSGSMGVVFKAYDKELDEIVVVKILPEYFATDADALARFRKLAKASRKLAHPNIVRIHEFGEEGGRKHISMEYVSGGDLRRMLSDKKLPPDVAVPMIRDVARALSHAHGEGVLHRDIKAANILLTPGGKVKVSDFGIAAMLTSDGPLDREATRAGTGMLGTPLYQSPELAEGGAPTTVSDLYSLGILFYEMLSGAPPFMRGSIAYHHQFTPPPIIPDISVELWPIIQKLLEKNPLERYQSAQEVLVALDIFSGRSPTRRTQSISDLITPIAYGDTAE